MQKIDLKSLGVSEMTQADMVTTEGGNWLSDLWQGIKDGWNAVKDFFN